VIMLRDRVRGEQFHYRDDDSLLGNPFRHKRCLKTRLVQCWTYGIQFHVGTSTNNNKFTVE